MSKQSHPLTPEVKQFANLNRQGDVIPHNWNKHIGRYREFKSKTGEMKQSWRSRPFAERLLARVVWLYTPTPERNSSGEVTSWKRKFSGPYWRIDQLEMSKALGCSIRTIVEELALLRELGLVRTQEARSRTAADGGRHLPIYVIPIYDAIVAITGKASEETALGIANEETALALPSEESSSVAGEDSSLEPVKKLPNTSIPSSSIPKTAEPGEKSIAANAARAASDESNLESPESDEDEPATPPKPASPKAKRTKATSEPFKASPLYGDLFARVARITKFDTSDKRLAGRVGQTAKFLDAKVAAGLTLIQVDCFADWWRKFDWRGQRGDPPTPDLIREKWGQFFDWQQDGQPEPATPQQRGNTNQPLKGYEKSAANIDAAIDRIREIRDGRN